MPHLTWTLQLGKPCKAALCPKESPGWKVRSEYQPPLLKPEATRAPSSSHRDEWRQPDGPGGATRGCPSCSVSQPVPQAQLHPSRACSPLSLDGGSDLSCTLVSSGPFLPDADSIEAACQRLLMPDPRGTAEEEEEVVPRVLTVSSPWVTAKTLESIWLNFLGLTRKLIYLSYPVNTLRKWL